MMRFHKYHGLGNDFVLTPMGQDHVAPTGALLKRLCARHLGVGADGVIYVGALTDGAVRMILYNPDGGRPQMCGNGVRCVVAMLADAAQLELGDAVTIVSDAGPRRCRLIGGAAGAWEVEVDMGELAIEPHPITPSGQPHTWHLVDAGNPHAVAFVDAGPEEIDAIGQAFNAGHEAFAQGVNAEFVTQSPDGTLEVAVYERGVGRTQACGTGACAAAAVAWRQGRVRLGEPARVKLPGGVLTCREQGGARVWMRGPAEYVFSGTLGGPQGGE